jgi:xanthine/CO dehydrogenase XdhC/CoxF family maturation factor
MHELDTVLKAVEAVQATGSRAALASVVAVVGSSYRRPGARMLVVEDGQTTGGVSGGCLESDVMLRAAAAIEDGKVALASYDTTGDDDVDFGVGLGCRGVIHVLIEPLPPDTGVHYLALLETLRRAREHAVLATVWRASGAGAGRAGNRLLYASRRLRWTDIAEAQLARTIAADAAEVLESRRSMTRAYELPAGMADVLLEYMPPPVPLVVFGGGPDVVPLVRSAKALGWHVTVVDPRARAVSRDRFPEADAVIPSGPEGVLEQAALASDSVAVVMTHNYHRDLRLLEVLLPSPVRYLGLLGPQARAQRLLHDLTLAGYDASPEQLRRLHAPAGLDLGADGPEEIALAIVAEVKATLAGRGARPLRDRYGPIHEHEAVERPWPGAPLQDWTMARDSRARPHTHKSQIQSS